MRVASTVEQFIVEQILQINIHIITIRYLCMYVAVSYFTMGLQKLSHFLLKRLNFVKDKLSRTDGLQTTLPTRGGAVWQTAVHSEIGD